MASFRRALEIYREHGLRSVLQSTRRYALHRVEEFMARTSSLYWTLALVYHRYFETRDIDEYDVPIDPLRIMWIDPERIVYQTQRDYPPWLSDAGRWSLFGRVGTGDWDIPNDDFSRSVKITERDDFRAFYKHFVKGVPWEEMEYVDRKVAKVKNGESTKLGTTREEIISSLYEYEQLYETIHDNGYLTQEELAKNGHEPKRFKTAMESEIAIDISRFGEPLFVDGSHRIAIAKILNLDRIPVVCYYRHEKWMRRRKQAYQDNETVHFDFAEWS